MKKPYFLTSWSKPSKRGGENINNCQISGGTSQKTVTRGYEGLKLGEAKTQSRNYGRFSEEDNGFSFGQAEHKELTRRWDMRPVHGDIHESEAQVRGGQGCKYMWVSSTYLWQLAIKMDEIVQRLQGNKIRRLSMISQRKPTLKDRMRNYNPQRIPKRNCQRGQRDYWESTVTQLPNEERAPKWE